MTVNLTETIDALRRYLSGECSVEAFEAWYYPRFKNEPADTPDDEHVIYAKVFGDLDAYTPPDLWVNDRKEYDIDEDELRKRLRSHLGNLNALYDKKSKMPPAVN